MRFYGLHAIQMQFSDQLYVIVMGNGFNTKNKIHEKYDLKVTFFIFFSPNLFYLLLFFLNIGVLDK